MNEKKKIRLENAGWRVGSAEDFLGLSDEEVAYIDLKMTLSQKLRQRREEVQWTQNELAKRLKSSQSRVAKIEAGDPSVSLDLLIRSLFTLGVTKADLSKMLVAEL